MAPFSQDLAAASLWPIKAKGKIQRLNPMGDPAVETFYHQCMVQGQFTERSIGEAQHWLAQKQKDLMQKILIHTRMNTLAVNGQLSNPARAILYAANSGTIIKDINVFKNEITGLIMAVQQNITMLLAIEAAMLSMVTQNLNALTKLLQMICNWHLPKLPSLPNLFPEGIWHWNGVQFAPLSTFEQQAKNLLKGIEGFSFPQCSLIPPSSLTSQQIPSSVSTYSGLTLGTTLIAPPLNGNISQDLTNPATLALMQEATSLPTYLSPADTTYSASGQTPLVVATPFNVNSSMLGSVPNPSTIVSNYQMPPAIYQTNIVSIVPQLRSIVTEQKQSSDLQKALIEHITLGEIVASNFDPNITAAWLFYLSLNREGRSGSWISNFQAAYTTYIIPSLTYLATNPIPWNCVVPSTTVNDTPTAIPLLVTLIGASVFTQGNLLWRLSYIEASLLGYTRNTTWDAYASGDYNSGFTGTDLDYRETSIDTTVTTTVTLGETTAEYPTSCTFPSAVGAVLQEVIAIASINIQNTPSYTTNRPQYKYVFNQFAIATEVDRFTQFWRTFNANLQALLVQDPYLIQFVVSYSASLDSAIDPLGDPTIYNLIQTDVATRNRSWVPGGVLLTIPEVPNVKYTPSGTAPTGWTGTSFDPTVYLSRPDIQQLSIPTQMAMLRTNLSYAAVQQVGQTISASIQASIQQSRAIIASFQNIGFSVEVASAINLVPFGPTGSQISFDQVNYDLTGNVTSPNTFTIQTAGNYAATVSLNWGAGDAGVRTGVVLLNGTTALSTSSTNSTQTGPTTIQMSFNQYFNVGDTLTVMATTGLTTPQTVIAGSYVSATLTDTEQSSTVGLPSSSLGATLTLLADTTIGTLTALIVDSTGGVVPVDPTTVQTDGQGNVIYPIITGISLTATGAGANVTVATEYGSVYEYTSANFTVGGLIYAVTGGLLTQDYTTVVDTCRWVVVVGRALSPNQFIYEPHIPNLVDLGTF